MKNFKVEKMDKNLEFDHLSGIFRKTGNFPENRASSVLSPYQCLTSCKKSEKSLEPFLRKSRKTVIFTTFSYFLNEPDFFWTCGFLRYFANDKKQFKLSKFTIQKNLKNFKVEKMSFFAYWRSSKREINFFGPAVFSKWWKTV